MFKTFQKKYFSQWLINIARIWHKCALIFSQDGNRNFLSKEKEALIIALQGDDKKETLSVISRPKSIYEQ